MRINRTTERTIQMLELISKHPKGLSLTEIINVMDIPKTSAFDILRTLDYLNMIELIDERAKIYTLSVKSFVIGSRYLHEIDLVKVARPFIESLGDEMSKTIFLGIINNEKVIYLDKYKPKSEILTTCKVGSENGIYCTSLGKAILAFTKNNKEFIKRIELNKITERTIIDRGKLNKELDEIKNQGFAIDNREHQDHMLCIGAPIFNHNKNVIAAISATGLYIEGKDYDSEICLVTETALKISNKLGYDGS